MVDSAARPSDIHRLFRTTKGRNSQIRFEDNDMLIRYFWSKEVDPGSSRSNSTNIFFSKWVKIHGTVPRSTDTVETMKTYLRWTADPELYASVFIPELQISSQPLVYARFQHGKLQQASVDHIEYCPTRYKRSANGENDDSAHPRGISLKNCAISACFNGPGSCFRDDGRRLTRFETTTRHLYKAPGLQFLSPYQITHSKFFGGDGPHNHRIKSR